MASSSRQPQEHDRTIKVTILASEWGSSKGGLSTINRELAIQLAKLPDVKISFFLPKCSHENKEEAQCHGISIVEAERRQGYEELDWLISPPDCLQIDVVVGHGVKLGKQAQFIRKSHKCRWVQVVHTDPEELGMFKCYENPISKGEQKHHDEVELCQMADLVVGVGPKLTEAFRKYLGFYKKDKDVFEFTPGVFADLTSAQQVPVERKHPSVLVFGRGDVEDFELKGFDIAARSVAALPHCHLVFVGAPEGKHDGIAKRFLDLGIPANRLRVRGYTERKALKPLFCEVDLVLMPSRTEGFGLTGLEALSAGLPVIVSRNSGFGEALNRVSFGSSFVIDSEDPSAWTAAIEGIWNKDRQTQLNEAMVLRDFYGKKYSWPEQCKNLFDKMVGLLENKQDAFGKCQISVQEGVETKRRRCSEDRTGSSDKVQVLLQGGGERQANRCSDLDKAAHVPNHVVKWIKQIYGKREGVILPVPWCEEFSFKLENIFTRLRIVAKEMTRGEVTKEITSMTSIFTPHEDCKQPLIVLIEGEPGMGKTTYCQKLAYDWATKQDREWDESFPRIEVLLLLRCREIQSSIREAIDDQILPEDIDPEVKERFFQFLQENPSKVLLVLDGLDEADPEKLKLILKLIQKEKLPGCFIVVTSRLEAGGKIKRYTDTWLEIVGFTTADAECFIRKYFQLSEHLAERLIAKLRSENLKELTRNPLNALLLCVIFEDFNGVFPNNRTQLYIEIVLFVLRRYESKNGLSSSGKDLLLVYKKELMTLGKMALDSLCKEELYFEDDKSDFKQSMIVKFGFLSIQAGGRKRAPCHRYGFFHKSFQEFFSALFLAFSIIDGEMDCRSVLTDERYWVELYEVFTFMSGIVATRSAETAMSIVHTTASLINVSGCDDDEYPLLVFFALEFIYECLTCAENLYTKLAYAFGRSLDLVDMFVPEFLSYRYVYLINTLFLALTVNSTVVELNCKGTRLSTEEESSLFQVLRVNTCISTLLLSKSFFRDEVANFLSQALRVNTSLTTLDLSDNLISSKGAHYLSQALRVNTSITSLDLSRNSISAEGVNSLSQALRVNTSLASMHLSYNAFGAYGAYYLSQALMVNTSLTTLHLSNNHISSKLVSFVASKVAKLRTTLDSPRNSQAVRANTSHTALDSSWNFDVPEGASSLAQALRVNASLCTLDLSGNFIRDEGVNSLSQALRENTSLTTLDLSCNLIHDKGASYLAQVLRVNTSLTTLNLSNNNIVEEGVHSLSQALVVNNSLTTLDLSLNMITFEAAGSLSRALSTNSSITCLHLSPMFSKRRDSEATTFPYLNPRIKVSWPWMS